MLDTIFQKFSLKKQHSVVYLSLLESGPLTAGFLSKKINVPRATLYGLLYDLKNKGLVIQNENNKVKVWQAAAPEKIANLVDENINSLEEVKLSLAGLLEDLKNKQQTDFIVPRFQYFEGPEGIKQIISDILLYRDIETECLWPIEDILAVFGREYFANLQRKRIRQNIFVKAIWPQNKKVEIKDYPFMGSSKEFRREVRIAPTGVEFSMGYWAYKNKTAFIASKKESFGFIVESAELRQLLKTQFEVLWKMSKPLIYDQKITNEFLKTL